jgi:hypothetical protein
MTNKDIMSKEIEGIQNSSDHVILNNPLSTPKFVRLMGRGKEVTVNDTYTPKVFYEIVSRLTPEHLEGIKRTETIKFELQIKDFLESIGANLKNFKYLIDSVDILQTTLLKWKEGDENFSVPIVTKSVHNEKTGKIEFFVDSDLAKHILEIKEKGNFSFLKSNIFRLQNAQAIRLYPFFKSWANHGRYATDLERFKNDFGYNTSGYNRFNKVETYILKPAIEEINEKTDLLVSYEATGENLESKRPRIKGLIFTIKSKDKIKKLEIAKEQAEPKPQKEKTQQNELSTLYTIFTSLKFEPTARLPRETAEATIMQWIDKNGYDAVYNGLMRAKDTYKQEIKNPIGFFSGDYFQNYKNYIQQKEQSKEEQQRAKAEQAQKEQQARKLKIILDDFGSRKKDYFKDCFNKQTEENKITFIQALKEQEGKNPRYFTNGQITTTGVLYLGQEIAIMQEGYNEGEHLMSFSKKTYNTVLKFDQEGKPFIQE